MYEFSEFVANSENSYKIKLIVKSDDLLKNSNNILRFAESDNSCRSEPADI